jgi:hypothetical protein
MTLAVWLNDASEVRQTAMALGFLFNQIDPATLNSSLALAIRAARQELTAQAGSPDKLERSSVRQGL